MAWTAQAICKAYSDLVYDADDQQHTHLLWQVQGEAASQGDGPLLTGIHCVQPDHLRYHLTRLSRPQPHVLQFCLSAAVKAYALSSSPTIFFWSRHTVHCVPCCWVWESVTRLLCSWSVGDRHCPSRCPRKQAHC